MDYLTRQLLLQLTKLQESYQKQSSAIDSIQKQNQQQRDISNERAEEFLSAYKKFEGDKTEGDQRQYKVQSSIRYATWLAALSALFAFGAACVYGWLTRQLWKEMQKQTGILREAGVNAERAWIGLDGPIDIDVLELTPRTKEESHYRIKNFGRGPATKVVVEGWFEAEGKLLPNMVKGECNAATEFSGGTVPHGPNVPNPGPMGYTLFPGQTHDETIGSPSDPWQGHAMPELKHFWLIGCIGYQDQFGKMRWTRFCMEPNNFVPHSVDKTIPLKFCALYNDTGDGTFPYP